MKPVRCSSGMRLSQCSALRDALRRALLFGLMLLTWSSFSWIGWFSAITSPAWAGGAEFNGTATSADGKTTTPTAKYEYNTQNNNLTVISIDTAVALGLGTFDKTTGVFTPNNDPSTGKAPPADMFNRGTVTGYDYQNITITITGSDGNPCPFKLSKVFVTKDNKTGANGVWSNDNTLNVDYINGIKGSIFGAGTNAKGFWPATPPADAKPASKKVDVTGDTRATFNFQLQGNNGSSNILPSLYESGTDNTYIPLAEAQALDLTLSSSPVDLSVLDPSDLATLIKDDLNSDGQTLFFEAVLPSLDDAYGLAAPNVDLTVLVNDDANSAFGILGADALADYANYSQPDGTQFLAVVPEPSSFAVLGTALAGLGFVRRRRNTTG